MKKLLLTLVAVPFVSIGQSAFVTDDMEHSKDMMKIMDTNGDGIVILIINMSHYIPIPDYLTSMPIMSRESLK